MIGVLYFISDFENFKKDENIIRECQALSINIKYLGDSRGKVYLSYYDGVDVVYYESNIFIIFREKDGLLNSYTSVIKWEKCKLVVKKKFLDFFKVIK